jgi:putative protease
MDRDHKLNPGDGLAFPGPSGRISGTLVNAVDGRWITIQSPNGIRQDWEIFRNFDHAWHKAMRSADADRRIGVSAWLDFLESSARLRLCDADGCRAEIQINENCLPPKKVDVFLQTARNALYRLGDTPFILSECHIDPIGFLPLSRLNAMRREVVNRLIQNRLSHHPLRNRRKEAATPQSVIEKDLSYEWNVSNSLARAFYERRGAEHIEQAYELGVNSPSPLLMTTRLCLKYELGWCPIHKNEKTLKNIAVPVTDIYLKNGPFTLKCQFDCRLCRMRLYLWTDEIK